MEVYFNGYKIKYEILNSRFLPIRASQKINSISIFINVDDLLHKLHKPYTNAEFQCSGNHVSRQLVSNLLNLVGHYRNWAIKEKMRPIVYLIYTTNSLFKNAIILPQYREHFKHINSPINQEFFFVNDAITNGLPILPVIMKYIPGAYAIDSGYLEPSIVPLFMSKQLPTNWNLMVSRDEYDLQYSYYDRWSYISPKGDNSTFVSKGNLWMYLAEKEKIDESFYFHPNIFLWAKVILGDRYRSIPKLTRTGWKTVIRYLKEFSNPLDTSEEALTIQLNQLTKYIEKKKIANTAFNDNMYCMDIQKQCDALLDTDIAMLQNQLTDMEDTKSLREINLSIFREFPLNLDFLLKQPSYNNNNPVHDKYFWKK